MLRFVIALALLALPGLAQARDAVIRDRGDRMVGTVTPTARGDLVVRDRAGRQVGSVTSTARGDGIVRDRAGRQVGSVTTRGR